MKSFSNNIFTVASSAQRQTADWTGARPYVEIECGNENGLVYTITAALGSDGEIDDAIDRLIGRLEMVREEAKSALRRASQA